MNLLTRYVFIQIAKTVLTVVMVGAAIQFFLLMVTEMGDLGAGHYHFGAVMLFTLLSLPNAVYLFFPMLALLGCILGLGQIASANELVVMRAAGLSVYRLITMVLFSSLIIVILASLLGEGLGAWASTHAYQYKEKKISGHSASIRSLWLRQNNDFLYASYADSTQLRHVSMFRFSPNQQLQSLLWSAKADHHESFWRFNHTIETHITPNQIHLIRQNHWDYPLNLNPMYLEVNHDTQGQQNLKRLSHIIAYRSSIHLQSINLRFNFWQRMFQPLATCIIMLLAIPFVFNCYGRVQMSGRLLFGVVVSFAFYLFNQFMGPFGMLMQWPVMLSVLLPIGLMLVAEIGIFSLMR